MLPLFLKVSGSGAWHLSCLQLFSHLVKGGIFCHADFVVVTKGSPLSAVGDYEPISIALLSKAFEKIVAGKLSHRL